MLRLPRPSAHLETWMNFLWSLGSSHMTLSTPWVLSEWTRAWTIKTLWAHTPARARTSKTPLALAIASGQTVKTLCTLILAWAWTMQTLWVLFRAWVQTTKIPWALPLECGRRRQRGCPQVSEHWLSKHPENQLWRVASPERQPYLPRRHREGIFKGVRRQIHYLCCCFFCCILTSKEGDSTPGEGQEDIKNGVPVRLGRHTQWLLLVYLIFAFATDSTIFRTQTLVCDPRRSFPTLPLYVDSEKVEHEADKQRMQLKAVEEGRGVWAWGRVIRKGKRNHIECYERAD